MLRSRTKAVKIDFRLEEVTAAKVKKLAHSWDTTVSGVMRSLIDAELARLHEMEEQLKDIRRFNTI